MPGSWRRKGGAQMWGMTNGPTGGPTIAMGVACMVNEGGDANGAGAATTGVHDASAGWLAGQRAARKGVHATRADK